MRPMKDSGVEWIGEIPENWSIIPMKSMFSYSKGLPITKADLVEKGIPVISYGQIHSKKNTGIRIENEFIRYAPIEYRNTNPLSQANEGDVLFADTSEDYDGIGNCIRVDREQEVYAGYHTIIARPKDSRFSKYWAFLFQTDSWRSQLRLQASGIKVFSITQRMLNGVSLIIPSLNDGVCIADYLDAKCAKIDALIAKQQEIIEKLKAYKLSVITEAVTKGLNPNVPMKDSGVEWIGQVPEHWSVLRLKNLFPLIRNPVKVGPFGSQLTTKDYVEEGVWVYNQRSILDNNFENTDTYISHEKYKEMQGFAVEAGDILVTTRGTGTTGHIARVPDKCHQGILHPCVIRFRLDENKCLYGYLAHVFENSRYLRNQIDFASNTSSLPVLYSDTLKNLYLVVPPMDEQKKILEWLDRKSAMLDSTIKHRECVIRKLQEYKKSLIYEVVTGKREV